MEVENVKAQGNVALEKLATEGNEKADELAKDGAMMGGGKMTQIRASTVQQRREEVYAALQYAAFNVSWRNGTTVKNSSRSQRKIIECGCKQIPLHDMRKQ